MLRFFVLEELYRRRFPKLMTDEMCFFCVVLTLYSHRALNES